MPLFPPVSRYSATSSKSDGEPPRQIRKVFCFGMAPALVSPTIAPFSTPQYAGSPSQPFRVLPSKIGVKLGADAKCAATNNSAASLRLRDPQSKRIQHAVLSAHIHAASAHRRSAEMREPANG